MSELQSSNTIQQINEAVQFLQQKKSTPPKLGLILSSGLGGFLADRGQQVDYSEIPHFPKASVPGHSGRLILGLHQGLDFVALQGRVHFYEGYSMQQVVFPTRVLCRLGIRFLLITNAAGGINRALKPGDLMLITDHINLLGTNPLSGPNEDGLGPRFPDMTAAYDPELREIIAFAGRRVAVELKRGVYAAVAGPSYETPAEVRMLEKCGADAVGMSTVPEVIAARHMGVRVAGLSMVSNMAAGLSPRKLDHSEVLETARQIEEKFNTLLGQVFAAFHKALQEPSKTES